MSDQTKLGLIHLAQLALYFSVLVGITAKALLDGPEAPVISGGFVSCSCPGPAGFDSSTSAAPAPKGEVVFDLEVRDGLVGIQTTRTGVPLLQTDARTDEDGDFRTLVSEHSISAAKVTGALQLSPLSR